VVQYRALARVAKRSEDAALMRIKADKKLQNEIEYAINPPFGGWILQIHML
jgi:hypothetical protein